MDAEGPLLPEYALWAAVLDRAYRDVKTILKRPMWEFGLSSVKNQHTLRLHYIKYELDALNRWMYEEYVGSLGWICAALDLPEQRVREIFKKEHARAKEELKNMFVHVPTGHNTREKHSHSEGPTPLDTNQEPADTNYSRFRGKCREMSEALVREDPTLRLVRGWYHCPIWGRQQHWWTVREDGTVVDPTRRQFPSGGIGEYSEFTGIMVCDQCGKEFSEGSGVYTGNSDAICSGECYSAMVLG